MARSLSGGARSDHSLRRWVRPGAEVVSENGRPPLRISGSGLLGGRLHVDASASSQFATALLMVAPYADDDLIVEVEGLRELGYVRLTVATMTRWGARVDEEAPGTFKVSARDTPISRGRSQSSTTRARQHTFTRSPWRHEGRSPSRTPLRPHSPTAACWRFSLPWEQCSPGAPAARPSSAGASSRA